MTLVPYTQYGFLSRVACFWSCSCLQKKMLKFFTKGGIHRISDRAYLPHMGDFVEPPPKPSTARDENPGKLLKLPSAPPLLSPFVPFWVLFGSPAMNWDHTVSWGREVWVSVSDIGRVGQPEWWLANRN